jgi:hypothetical protein
MRAGGTTLAEALRSVGLSRNTWSAYLRRFPDRRARYLAIVPDTGLALVAAKFGDIIAAVEAGEAIKAAVLRHGCTDVAFYKHVRNTEGARERLVAATEQRGAIGGHVAKLESQKVWSDADYDRALDAIAKARGSVSDVLGGDLPGAVAVASKARYSKTFRDRLAIVMGERIKRREAEKPPVSPTGESHHLLDALLRDGLYRAARSVTAGFDPNDRDDVVSELILAALEGEFDAADFKKNRMLALKRGVGHRARFLWLDAPISDSDGDTFADMIASPCGIHTY